MNLVMLFSLASKCQDFKVGMPFFQPFYVMKLKTSKFKAFWSQWRYHYQIQVLREWEKIRNTFSETQTTSKTDLRLLLLPFSIGICLPLYDQHLAILDAYSYTTRLPARLFFHVYFLIVHYHLEVWGDSKNIVIKLRG